MLPWELYDVEKYRVSRKMNTASKKVAKRLLKRSVNEQKKTNKVFAKLENEKQRKIVFE